MVDFINEVEEELRKDKYNTLLRKFGPYIIGLIIAVIAATGFLEFQKYSKSKKARSTSASYVAATKLAETGDLQAAIDRFIALSEVAPSGYAGLSLSRAAGMKVQLGDMEGAVSLFDRSADAFTMPLHKDLSSLKAAYLLMDQGRYDDVKARLSAISGDDAPFRDLAKELSAHATLKSGDTESARKQLTYLSNVPGVLSGVKTRAGQTLTLMNASRPVSTPDIAVVDAVVPAPVPDAPKPQEDK